VFPLRTETIIRFFDISQRFQRADHVVTTLDRASHVGWFGKACAVVSLIEDVGYTLVGAKGGFLSWLQTRGYQRGFPHIIESFVGQTLLEFDIPRISINSTGWDQAESCSLLGDGVAAVIQRYSDIYVLVRDYERTRQWVADAVWTQGDIDLRLGYVKPDQNTPTSIREPFGGSPNIILTPLVDPGPYIAPPGGKDISWYANRIRRFGSDNTFMFVGPSGSGKSVLCRNVARQIRPGKHVLRVSCENHVPIQYILALTDVLQPDVVQMDDLGIVSADGTSNQSEIATAIRDLEDFRLANRMGEVLILLTVMAKAGVKIRINGIRAGRVDDVFYLPGLDLAWRRRILEHFASDIAPAILDDVAALTDGFTGACLQNLAHRLHVFGTDRETILAEIEAVRNFSPGTDDDQSPSPKPTPAVSGFSRS